MTGRFSLDNPRRRTFRWILELKIDLFVGGF
jgi:hypothetical protein